MLKRFQKNLNFIFAFLLLFCLFSTAQAKLNGRINQSKDGRYNYLTVDNDPLQTRIYTLQNGLKVYLSVNHAEPRIYTIIAARVGSKNDPHQMTGMAHYLEHMLFKGTDKFGTLDYDKEYPLINLIGANFDLYRSFTDSTRRANMYHLIDTTSYLASAYAIPNEYDKMMTFLGSKGTNANTTDERTAYVEDIPSNQLTNWLKIESERFRNPVFRLFHTELEAVYEEKNISLDNDGRKAWDKMMQYIFKFHPYGTQTTLGTVEHLKNPSMTRLAAYYHKYYIPNNMCICLSGDFDPDSTIILIDQYFKSYQSKEVPTFEFDPEEEITQPIYQTVTGPEPESMMIGFRLPAANSPDIPALKMFDMILGNGKAGLIDLNIKQQQKMREPWNGDNIQTDYGVYVLGGMPLEGQSLEHVKDLLLEQIELVKKGKFDESLLEASVNNYEINELRASERNVSRSYKMLESFTLGQDWVSYISLVDELRSVTKQQVIDVANKYFKNNYVVIYKKQGPKEDVEKVIKPKITPVILNRDSTSEFVKSILASKPDEIKPMFLDYNHDIFKSKIAAKADFQYLKNNENELFTLYYIIDMGSLQDLKLPLAVDYFDYLGTDKMSASEVKKLLYKYGSSFGVSTANDRCYIYVSGLSHYFKESVELFEDVLANAKPDNDALKKMINNILKDRSDAKTDKYEIKNALNDYVTYGKFNPTTNILSEKQLKNLEPEELTQRLKDICTYQHTVSYYGPEEPGKVIATLEKLHKMPQQLKPLPPAKDYIPVETNENEVYFTNYDMVQVEITWITRSIKNFQPELAPVVRLYNQYFGGDMSSVVFQTLRESKALAYSCYSGYFSPSKKDEFYKDYRYIGSQADKLNEAVTSMNDLFDNFPESVNNFNKSKDAIMRKIESERILRTSVLFSYLSANDLGINYDIRRDIYSQVPGITMQQLVDFQNKYIKGKPTSIAIFGSKDKIKKEDLEKYGKVHILSLEDIFGY